MSEPQGTNKEDLCEKVEAAIVSSCGDVNLIMVEIASEKIMQLIDQYATTLVATSDREQKEKSLVYRELRSLDGWLLEECEKRKDNGQAIVTLLDVRREVMSRLEEVGELNHE